MGLQALRILEMSGFYLGFLESENQRYIIFIHWAVLNIDIQSN